MLVLITAEALPFFTNFIREDQKDDINFYADELAITEEQMEVIRQKWKLITRMEVHFNQGFKELNTRLNFVDIKKLFERTFVQVFDYF